MAEPKVKEFKGMRGGARGPRPKLNNPTRTIKRIFQFMGRHYTLHLIIVLLCIIASVFSNIQGTWFIKSLVDDYIQGILTHEKTFADLAQAMLKVAGFYGLGIIAALIQAEIMVFVTQGTLKELRNEMFNHMQSLPIKYFDTHSHGDIMSLYTNDIDTLRQMISQSMPQMINSTITVVSVFGSMLMLSVPLTIITLLMIGVVLFVSKTLTGLSGRFFVAQQKDLGAVNGYIEEMISGQKVVKVFCHEEKAIEEFNRINDQLCVSANNANKFANVLAPCNAQLGNVSYVLCACVGAVLAIVHPLGFSMTAGALVSFLTFNKQLEFV